MGGGKMHVSEAAFTTAFLPVLFLCSLYLSAVQAQGNTGGCGQGDGSCIDPVSPCCSQNNYRGSTADYCGNGCQAGYSFGSACTLTSSPPAVNTTGACGQPSGSCKNSEYPCCSPNNFCGSTADHCGIGCQSQYSIGSACAVAALAPASAPALAPTPAGVPNCGASIDARCFVAGFPCCSSFGFCGNSSLHCSEGCQPEYSFSLTSCEGSQAGEQEGTNQQLAQDLIFKILIPPLGVSFTGLVVTVAFFWKALYLRKTKRKLAKLIRDVMHIDDDISNEARVNVSSTPSSSSKTRKLVLRSAALQRSQAQEVVLNLILHLLNSWDSWFGLTTRVHGLVGDRLGLWGHRPNEWDAIVMDALCAQDNILLQRNILTTLLDEWNNNTPSVRKQLVREIKEFIDAAQPS
eukprot:jgi/Chlat1/7773/Chrsp66S07242